MIKGYHLYIGKPEVVLGSIQANARLTITKLTKVEKTKAMSDNLDVQMHILDSERFVSDDHEDVVQADRFIGVFMETIHIISEVLTEQVYLRFTNIEQCGRFLRVIGTYSDIRRFFTKVCNYPALTRVIAKDKSKRLRAVLSNKRVGWQGPSASWVRATLSKIMSKIIDHGATPLDEIDVRNRGYLISTEDHPGDIWRAIQNGKLRLEVEDTLAKATQEMHAVQWPGIFSLEDKDLW